MFEDNRNDFQEIVTFENREEIEKKLIRPFLDWARTNIIIPPKITTSAKIAGVSGFITGAVGVYAFFPLGGDFAITISNALGIKDDGLRKALYGFFATDAIIPMIALAGLATKNHFQELATPSLEYPLITKQNRKLIRKGLIATAYILGAFAAINPAYVTCQVLAEQPLWLKVLMSIPAYLGGFMYKIDAERKLLDRAFDSLSKGETEFIIKIREKLKNKLAASMKAITAIKDKEIDDIFHSILGETYSNDLETTYQEQTMNRIKLMYTGFEDKNVEIETEKPSPLKKWGGNIASASGFIIGGMSAYTYFALGEEAILAIFDLLGIHDPLTRSIVSKLIASLIVVPWGALGAEATQKRFEQIYYSFFDKSKKTISNQSYPKVRTAMYAYSFFGGASAAIPLTYLAIEATKSMPLAARIALVIPAFLGPASVRTNAINTVLNKGVDWYSGFKSESPELRRDKLLNAMSTISSALDKLPDNQIIALYNNIFESQPELLVNVNATNDIGVDLLSATLDERSSLLNSENKPSKSWCMIM